MEDAMPAIGLHFEAAKAASMSDQVQPPGEQTDEQLMQAYAGGRAAAFNELFQRYRMPVVGFFRRRVTNQARAEELAQETFLAVVRASGRYEQTALFRTWLYAIAFRILHAHRRKAAFRATFLAAPKEMPEPSVPSSVEAEVVLRQAVGKLDPMDREVLLLREFEQLRYDEIAAVLGVPLNTVRTRLYRARMALHSLLTARNGKQKEAL